MAERNCDYCGQFFQPNRPWQRFCPGGDCKKNFERAQRDALKAMAGKQDDGKNPAAVAMGKKRMAMLTPDERKQLARKASQAAADKRRKSHG